MARLFLSVGPVLIPCYLLNEKQETNTYLEESLTGIIHNADAASWDFSNWRSFHSSNNS